MQLSAEEEQQIRRYLLGIASEEERASVEKRMFDDDDWSESLQAYELEVIRDYLRWRLPGDARRQFRRYQSENPDLARKVEEERRILDTIDFEEETETAKAIKPPRSERLKGLFTFRLPAVAFAGLAILLVGVLAWNVSLLTHSRAKSPVSRVIVPPVFSSFLLTPGVLRDESGGARRLEIPSSTTDIRLQLEYAQASKDNAYLVRLRAVGGAEVASARAVATSTNLVEATLGTAGLATNDYILSLESRKPDGQYETVETYTFGIVRR